MAQGPIVECLVSLLAIAAARDESVTFSRDVAPILLARCAACHRPGEAAPFSLLTYDDARRRAAQIAEVTRSRFMPPWLPKPSMGPFAEERLLTPREIDTLARWAEAAAPQGDPAEAPPPPRYTEGWQLGEPDLVLESPEFELPADGGDVFRNFVLPPKLDRPRWVRAIELRPSRPRVTHHARLGIDASRESARRDAQDPQPGYEGMAWGQDPEGQLITWTPGMTADPGATGAAWLLRPQAALVLHTHLQPSGKAELAGFRVGLYFADEPPGERPVVLRIGSRAIDIPAGAARHVVSDEYTLPVDVELRFVFPHAHALCRALAVEAVLPGGDVRPLIAIDRFDEKWHDKYRYAEPVRLPEGTRLRSTFVYDNSAANERNPHDPPRRVVYGSRADDEMADVYLQVAPLPPERRAVLLEHYGRYDARSTIAGARRTLELHPEDPWVREGLAAAHLRLGQPGAAVAALEGHAAPGSEAVYRDVILAMACLAEGDRARAERLLRQATQADPLYAAAWHGLGQALAAAGRSDEAEAALRRALELAPELSVAQLDLADLLIAQNRLEEAEKACVAAAAAAPDKPLGYLKLAELRARQRRYDDSLKFYAAARRVAPYTYAAKAALAAQCYQLGDEVAARRFLDEAERELPSDPVPQFYLGQVARRDERWSEARQRLDRAATLPIPRTWPESHGRQFLTLVHGERLQLAQQIQDLALARDAAAAWLQLDPENPRVRELNAQVQATKE